MSDEEEQLSAPELYGAQHCGACGSPCSGSVPHGNAACEPIEGIPSCVASCTDPFAYADCDGELSTDCEVEVTDPSSIYYLDSDGDGFGDPDEPLFACSGEQPNDYVDNADDCNDGDPAIHPDATEVCEGTGDQTGAVDNNCDGSTTDIPGWGEVCGSGAFCTGTMQCSNGALACDRPDRLDYELCDGEDNDCNGTADDNVLSINDDRLGEHLVAAIGLSQVFGCEEGKPTCIVDNEAADFDGRDSKPVSEVRAVPEERAGWAPLAVTADGMAFPHSARSTRTRRTRRAGRIGRATAVPRPTVAAAAAVAADT